MPAQTRLALAGRNLIAAAIGTAMNGCDLLVYSGTAPSTADDPVTVDAVLLASFVLPTSAFGDPVEGIITNNPVTPAIAIATGKPTWFRVQQTDNTVLWQGAVGFFGTDLNLDVETVAQNAELSIVLWRLGVADRGQF